jgi:hypothetical protein
MQNSEIFERVCSLPCLPNTRRRSRSLTTFQSVLTECSQGRGGRDVATFATQSLPSFSHDPDDFQAMLLGRHRMDEHFRTTPVEKKRTSRVENQLLTSTQG